MNYFLPPTIENNGKGWWSFQRNAINGGGCAQSTTVNGVSTIQNWFWWRFRLFFVFEVVSWNPKISILELRSTAQYGIFEKIRSWMVEFLSNIRPCSIEFFHQTDFHHWWSNILTNFNRTLLIFLKNSITHDRIQSVSNLGVSNFGRIQSASDYLIKF